MTSCWLDSSRKRPKKKTTNESKNKNAACLVYLIPDGQHDWLGRQRSSCIRFDIEESSSIRRNTHPNTPVTAVLGDGLWKPTATLLRFPPTFKFFMVTETFLMNVSFAHLGLIGEVTLINELNWKYRTDSFGFEFWYYFNLVFRVYYFLLSNVVVSGLTLRWLLPISLSVSRLRFFFDDWSHDYIYIYFPLFSLFFFSFSHLRRLVSRRQHYLTVAILFSALPNLLSPVRPRSDDRDAQFKSSPPGSTWFPLSYTFVPHTMPPWWMPFSLMQHRRLDDLPPPLFSYTNIYTSM